MTQKEQIIDYIDRHGSITPMDAFHLGITKLATRVSEMRKDGTKFHIVMEKGINKQGKRTRYARYSWGEE